MDMTLLKSVSAQAKIPGNDLENCSTLKIYNDCFFSQFSDENLFGRVKAFCEIFFCKKIFLELV